MNENISVHLWAKETAKRLHESGFFDRLEKIPPPTRRQRLLMKIDRAREWAALKIAPWLEPSE